MTEKATGSGSFLTPRRLASAGVAAVAACGAVCALPTLAALGVLGVGGGAMAAAALVTPASELIAGAAAFAVALAGMALWARRARHKGSSDATTNEGCGCSAPGTSLVYRSPTPRAGEPIQCTAKLRDTVSVQAHVDGYRAAFTRLVAAERFSGGFRWTFRAEPGLEARLQGLAAREHDCCKFFHFEITTQGDHIIWETRAEDSAACMIDELFRVPERLREEPRRGHDVAALKRAAGAAGLNFTADSAS